MRVHLLLLAALIVTAGTATAGKVYKWTDANGRVHYGDVPPEGVGANSEVQVKLGTTTQAMPVEEDSEEAAAKRAELCSAKRDQLTSYQTALRLIEKDSLGREHEYTQEERDLLVTKTQDEIVKTCGEQPQG